MTTRNVVVLVGSLRKQSFNRKIANEIIALAPASLNLEIVEIGQLSFFNQDLEATPPADWVEFRARVAKADAALFVRQSTIVRYRPFSRMRSTSARGPTAKVLGMANLRPWPASRSARSVASAPIIICDNHSRM